MSLSDCRKCPLRILEESPVLPAGNVGNAQLAVVTRRATREDLLWGEPASDPAGKMMRAAMEKAGLERVFLTSVTKCAPAAAAKPTCPSPCRQTCAKEWLIAELNQLPLAVPICLMGQAVATEVLGFCGWVIRNRPLYVFESEASLMTGGAKTFEEFALFFQRLKCAHP